MGNDDSISVGGIGKQQPSALLSPGPHLAMPDQQPYDVGHQLKSHP